jgi:[ribosomal protein S18]-alanine N-acetyltransferase
MHYRLYASADFSQLYSIEEACFREPDRFGRGYMRSLIAHPASATWIAEDAGAMAGFAIVHWSGDPPRRSAYIQTIEVADAFRRQGIARRLLQLVEQSARDAGASLIWLHVDAANAPAIALYSAAGYLHHGSAENYYGPGRPAGIYARPLQPHQPESHAPHSGA